MLLKQRVSLGIKHGLFFYMRCLSSWNSSQQKTIINAMAVNEDGVMVTGGNKFISQLFFVIVFLQHLTVIIIF